jgi:nucleotide-binding universal stress UspA family protein
MTAHNPRSAAGFHRPLKTVLVGTSLDPESDPVVRTGLCVARAAGARVYLVHAAEVEPPLVLASEPAADLVADETARREEALRAQVARLGIAPGELAGTRVEAGRAHRVVVEAARATGAGLIVLGATGAGPLAAELLGSTADRVLRQATCPVLVVRGEPRIPPARVLAPVDLSELSGDALRCGLDLLAQLDPSGQIAVRAAYALSFLDIAGRRRTDDLSLGEAEELSARELARFVDENRPEAPCEIATAVLPGEARYEILRELAVHPADLVMLGTHGRGSLDRLILGSVAATVARRAPVSVLMVPPEAALGEGIAASILARTTPVWHPEPVPTAR